MCTQSRSLSDWSTVFHIPYSNPSIRVQSVNNSWQQERPMLPCFTRCKNGELEVIAVCQKPPEFKEDCVLMSLCIMRPFWWFFVRPKLLLSTVILFYKKEILPLQSGITSLFGRYTDLTALRDTASRDACCLPCSMIWVLFNTLWRSQRHSHPGHTSENSFFLKVITMVSKTQQVFISFIQ